MIMNLIAQQGSDESYLRAGEAFLLLSFWPITEPEMLVLLHLEVF